MIPHDLYNTISLCTKSSSDVPNNEYLEVNPERHLKILSICQDIGMLQVSGVGHDNASHDRFLSYQQATTWFGTFS